MNCEDYEVCIEACLHCASVCHRCASIAMTEDHVSSVTKLNMECAAVCTAAGTLMSFESSFSEKISRMCVEICGLCAASCEKESGIHYKLCAKACRECIEECHRCHPVED